MSYIFNYFTFLGRNYFWGVWFFWEFNKGFEKFRFSLIKLVIRIKGKVKFRLRLVRKE